MIEMLFGHHADDGSFVEAAADQRAAYEAALRAFASPDSSRRFSVIPSALADDVERVAPSHPLPGVDFRPCRVTMRNGETHERVLVVDADMYKQWGSLWPDSWPVGRQPVLAILDVAAITESALRLPADMASAVWTSSERFGFYAFTLTLTDGREVPCAATLPDFPNLPPGVQTHDCVAVNTNKALRTRPPSDERAPYVWCLYRNE